MRPRRQVCCVLGACARVRVSKRTHICVYTSVPTDSDCVTVYGRGPCVGVVMHCGVCQGGCVTRTTDHQCNYPCSVAEPKSCSLPCSITHSQRSYRRSGRHAAGVFAEPREFLSYCVSLSSFEGVCDSVTACPRSTLALAATPSEVRGQRRPTRHR